MSFHHSWIAMKGLDRAACLAELGLEVRPEPAARSACEAALAELPDGWLLLLTRDDAAFKARFVALSKGRSAVACWEDDRVMHADARGYDDGRQTWRVAHEPEKGVRHLQIDGDPPQALEAIRAEQAALQDAEGGERAQVDFIFEVPPELAKSICGFRLGDDGLGLTFSELRPAREAHRPNLLQRLFGRA
ncbi:MAG: hypothetical protein E7812_19405 [Phenylobacterium sp.]|nr:MAG: hypothetical protein E7812_19405 [Phenylobacterium sp.]